MNRCLICRTQNVEDVLDLGRQPIANRFLPTADAPEAVFPMVIGQCQACGMVQSLKPVAVNEVVPRVDWISYNEPEGHLDAFVEKLCHLPGITRESVIGGVTFKDDTTLARFNKKGFTRTWRVNPREDLDILDSRCGAEMIQDRLTCDAAEKIVQKYGAADLVIVRHVFEHAYDPYLFLQAIKKLIHPDGYIVLEVPDCSRAFDRHDYTTLWEEHILYFTPVTFQECFARMGFSLCRYERYPYLFEDSLIAVVQPLERTDAVETSADLQEKERKRIKIFADNLSGQSRRLRMYLKEYRRDQGKIALFGAGHLACAFVNFLGLKEDIAFFVDDNSNKKGLFMPGSRLPIYGSHSLLEEHIKLCLLSLNPLSEEKVIANNKNFTDQGGTFKSIFPASKHVLELLAVVDEEHKHAHQGL